MKIRIISDIHNEFNRLNFIELPEDSESILIIAGDLDVHGRASKSIVKNIKGGGELKVESFLHEMGNRFLHVVVVLGNHDYWGSDYYSIINKMKNDLKEDKITNVHILENETFVIDNLKFVGFTFWTDLRKKCPMSMNEAQFSMVDYKKIRYNNYRRKFNAEDSVIINLKSKKFLRDELEKEFDGKVIVVSHHAPLYNFVNAKFIGDTLNYAYYNTDLEDLFLDNDNLNLWVHGHVHDSSDKLFGCCRIVCNPRGYAPDYLNTDFNETFIIETDNLGY